MSSPEAQPLAGYVSSQSRSIPSSLDLSEEKTISITGPAEGNDSSSEESGDNEQISTQKLIPQNKRLQNAKFEALYDFQSRFLCHPYLTYI